MIGASNLNPDERDKKHNYMWHRLRVSEARKTGDKKLMNTIQVNKPLNKSIVINNSKAIKLEEQRLSRIELHNRILFNHIQEIDSKPAFPSSITNDYNRNRFHLMEGQLDKRKRKL